MCRAALTPLPERQSLCVAWLRRHFNTFGNMDPNGIEIKLQVMRAKEVYEQYVKEFKQFASHAGVVDYSLFMKLWHTVFPHCRSRPWCCIPGKCDTCCFIDIAERDTEDTVTHEYLQQAHLLHRGGLFGLERAA